MDSTPRRAIEEARELDRAIQDEDARADARESRHRRVIAHRMRPHPTGEGNTSTDLIMARVC